LIPTLPIPVFVAFLLAFACLRLCADQRRPSFLGSLLALCAAQSFIIALAQHYMVPGIRRVQPVSAALVPPVAWLAYVDTALRPAARCDLLHGLVPLAALAALLVAPAFLDVLLPAAFVGYGVAILMQALRGADAQPQTLLAHDNLPARIWLVMGAALVASALSDVLIVLAQATGRAEARGWIITVWRRKPKTKVHVHSDQGSQFTGDEWQEFLEQHNLVPSMSRRGNCWDNAAVESFFNLLKRERIRRKKYKTRAEARRDVFDYTEFF